MPTLLQRVGNSKLRKCVFDGQDATIFWFAGSGINWGHYRGSFVALYHYPCKVKMFCEKWLARLNYVDISMLFGGTQVVKEHK